MNIFVKSFRDLDNETVQQLKILLKTCSFEYSHFPGVDGYACYGIEEGVYLFAMSLYVFPESKNTIEIYDVCVSRRGAGIGSAAFRFLISHFSKEYKLWLGVLISNIEVCKFYAKLGFTDVWLTRLSPGGMSTPNFEYFISMTYNPYKNNNSVVSDEILKFHNIAKILNSSQEFKYNTLSFEKLFHFTMKKSVEYGFIVDYIGGELRVLDSGQVKGTEKEFTIMPPTYIFNGHTHPLNAFVEIYSMVGWPSGQDFMFLLNEDRIIHHYVLSYRGIYIMEISLAARIFYKFLSKAQKKLFNDIVYKKMSSLETYRSIKHFDQNLFYSMVYLLSKCRTEAFYKEFTKIIAQGGCDEETKNLQSGYINQFLSITNTVTFADFNIGNIENFKNPGNPTMFDHYIDNKIISNDSTLFKVVFIPYRGKIPKG